MTDQYWINTYGSQGGKPRKIHRDKDCFLLNRSPGKREATPTQIEKYDECRWCDPSAQIDFSNQGEGHLESLLEAAREETV